MPPPQPAVLSAPLRLRPWLRPDCTCPKPSHRTFHTTPTPRAVGPEHPRYIKVPVPPQQNAPERRFIKGRLPVPRDVFAGAHGQDKASPQWMNAATLPPQRSSRGPAVEGSREDFKLKMSEMRRRNLREGLTSLRIRRTRDERRRTDTALRNAAEREELLHRPERADERLTAPSHSFDLEALYHAPLADPTREARLETKRSNLAAYEDGKRAARLESLHTLYLNARTFIVTPAQLETAVDEAFGTTEQPANFAVAGDEWAPEAQSVWAYGQPERVQDMLNRANGQGSRFALDDASGAGRKHPAINAERIKRIAEMLTGGDMEER